MFFLPQYLRQIGVFSQVLLLSYLFSACVDKPLAFHLEVAVIGACADGVDNDHDGWIDLADAGCNDSSDADEGGFSTTACNDGLDNDGDGFVDADDKLCHSAVDDSESIGLGDVLISEFLADPEAVTDAEGEWIELYNNSHEAIDLTGWILSDNSREHVIIGALFIPAFDFIVLSRSENGVNGLPELQGSDYIYSTLQLTNSGGSVSLQTSEGVLIATLAYDKTQVATGKSWGLDGRLFQSLTVSELAQAARQNNRRCFSQTVMFSGADSASPGGINDGC
ncbi:MAG: lamin tail domain-containing protein [Pseudomonadales bacterium]|nr:lamin tail domain-containing protein [Pseudomonadales bacterium]